MNLLRKPGVVALLSLVALALLFRDLLRPWVRKHGSSVTPVALPIASIQGQPVAADLVYTEEASKPPNEGSPQLDLATLEKGAGRWMRAPARDPFSSRFDDKRQASSVLTLKGIWRQTDGNFAVINGVVVGPGDRILDFTIDKIEADRVWVAGPNGREELNFKIHSVEVSSRSQQEFKR